MQLQLTNRRGSLQDPSESLTGQGAGFHEEASLGQHRSKWSNKPYG